MKIDVSATSGAYADGVSTNEALVIVSDDNGSLVPDVGVAMSLSSNATFVASGTNLFIGETDVFGQIKASFVDDVPEIVSVVGALLDSSSILDSTESQFVTTGEVNVLEKITMFVSVDNSPADGKSNNQVEIGSRTMSGEVVKNAEIKITLDNGAVFIDGSSQTIIRTDTNGNASVVFTNSVSGTVNVKAFDPNNVAVFSQTVANFKEVSNNINPQIMLEIISDNAVNNGKALNAVKANLKDLVSGQYLPDYRVLFEVSSGSALFSLNNMQDVEVYTNSLGEVIVSLHDLTVESVQLKATVTIDSQTVSESIMLNFTSEYSPLTITQVYNNNKKFDTRKPSVAWYGAEFNIDISGGSGNYECAATGDGENGNALIFDTSVHNHIKVICTEDINFGVYKITITDIETHEAVEYLFDLNTIYTEHGRFESIHWVNINGRSEELPTPEELKRLHEEWGNMSSYFNWISPTQLKWYWSDDFDFTGIFGTVINLTTGEENIIADTFAIHGFAAKKLI